MAISVSKPRTITYLGREAIRTTYQHDDGTGLRAITTTWTDTGTTDVKVFKGRYIYAEVKDAEQAEVDDMLFEWIGLVPLGRCGRMNKTPLADPHVRHQIP